MYDKDDNFKQRFEYVDQRMPISMTYNNTKYYLHYDQVGSLRAITDKEDNLVKEIVYDSYGNILSDSNEAFKIPFGFAGGLYDTDTKLTRFGYRDYDAYTGKWTAKDPIGFSGGDSNLYGYVLGNPVGFFDSDGLEVEAWYSISKGSFVVIDSQNYEYATMTAYSGGNPYGKSIPLGTWEILERGGKKDFFRLDAIDKIPRNDKHEDTGRDVFRLHKPGRSIGCVTAENKNSWNSVRDLIYNTSTTKVSVESLRYWGFWKTKELIKKYGILHVIR